MDDDDHDHIRSVITTAQVLILSSRVLLDRSRTAIADSLARLRVPGGAGRRPGGDRHTG